jgi:hypothetical protein
MLDLTIAPERETPTMLIPKIAKLLPAVGVAALLLCWGQASHADVIFDIQVDTSSLPGIGVSGSLDFQFNPASGAAAATASVYSFSSDGTLVGSPTLTSGVSGNLTSGNSLSFSNSSSVNEATQTFTYGSFFDIFVDLNIPAPGFGPTSTFFLTINDQNGNPVQSGFLSNAAVLIQPNPDGTYLVDSGGPTVIPAISVPEPSTFKLAAICLAFLAMAITVQKGFFCKDLLGPQGVG